MVAPNYGGARAGAGRKPKAGVARTEPIPVKLSPAELAHVREQAIAAELSLAAFVRLQLGVQERQPKPRIKRKASPRGVT